LLKLLSKCEKERVNSVLGSGAPRSIQRR
jgi:hypothetical protein